MYPPIFKVAAASPTVQAALGTDPTRLYPFGEAPEGVADPYAVWQTIDGVPGNYLGSRPDIDLFALQVDVYGNSADSARQAGAALRDAIELHAHITRWGGERKDPATGRYRLSFDVDWHAHR
ncbi:tail completion protein gp17 [Stutzerimonas nitrititolerans]|uniref:tail completion protein gp17 n=1 Tax=Stutzerimonas nitrititolerans TaxID=2482751 RepID=UPI0028AC50D4|nr:DUF3168 domain-containing protein [Stutzerimonas nitrititolerans]